MDDCEILPLDAVSRDERPDVTKMSLVVEYARTSGINAVVKTCVLATLTEWDLFHAARNTDGEESPLMRPLKETPALLIRVSTLQNLSLTPSDDP